MSNDHLLNHILFGDLDVGAPLCSGQNKQFKSTLKIILKDFNFGHVTWEAVKGIKILKEKETRMNERREKPSMQLLNSPIAHDHRLISSGLLWS